MNKNHIEVELKFQVTDRKKLIKWLEDNASLIFTDHQLADYYTPANRDFFSKKYPIEYLRIRKSGEHSYITYKNGMQPKSRKNIHTVMSLKLKWKTQTL